MAHFGVAVTQAGADVATLFYTQLDQTLAVMIDQLKPEEQQLCRDGLQQHVRTTASHPDVC